MLPSRAWAIASNAVAAVTASGISTVRSGSTMATVGRNSEDEKNLFSLLIVRTM